MCAQKEAGCVCVCVCATDFNMSVYVSLCICQDKFRTHVEAKEQHVASISHSSETGTLTIHCLM